MHRVLIIALGICSLLIADKEKGMQIINNGERKISSPDSSVITTDTDKPSYVTDEWNNVNATVATTSLDATLANINITNTFLIYY